MMDRIFIYMPAGKTKVDWLVQSGHESSVRSGHDTLSDIAPMCSDKQVVLVVPGQSVSLGSVSLPIKNRQQLLKALPFALEEQVADEIENLHFAAGEKGTTNNTPVAITNSQQMRNWLDILSQHDIRAEIIIPETLLLPWSKNEWSAIVHDNTVSVRTGTNNGFSCDSENTGFMLQAALKENKARPERINLFMSDHARVPPNLEQLSAEITSQSINDNILSVMYPNINGTAIINLMQGVFTPKKSIDLDWKILKPAMFALALWALLYFGGTIAKYFWLNHEYQKLDDEIVTLYQELFPGSKQNSNIRSLLESKLKQIKAGASRDSNGFIPLLSQIGIVLNKIPGVEIKNINYRNSSMEMEIMLGDLQVLEKVKTDLAAGGLVVDVQSASAQDNKVVSRLRIQGRTS